MELAWVNFLGLELVHLLICSVGINIVEGGQHAQVELHAVCIVPLRRGFEVKFNFALAWWLPHVHEWLAGGLRLGFIGVADVEV